MHVGHDSRWGKFSKKRCSDYLVFISANIHIWHASVWIIPSFENHFCYSARKDAKEALSDLKLWKINLKASFRILSVYSQTHVSLCLYEVCKFFRRSLMLLKTGYSLFERRLLKMLPELWLWSCITKHIHTRPWGLGLFHWWHSYPGRVWGEKRGLGMRLRHQVPMSRTQKLYSTMNVVLHLKCVTE